MDHLELTPPPLDLLTARITLRSPAQMEPLATPGVALRGGLGAALHRVYCAPRQLLGHPAPHDHACPYCALYAPGPLRERLGTNDIDGRGLKDAPRPYVIRAVQQPSHGYRQGAPLEFDLVLIGWAAAYLPAIIAALRVEGGINLSQGRGTAPLGAVALVNPLSGKTTPLLDLPPGGQPGASWASEVPPVSLSGAAIAAAAAALPDTVTIYLRSPLRLRERGQWLRHPDPYALVVNSLRRLGLLCLAYGAGPWTLAAEPERRAAVLAASERVQPLSTRTEWIDAARQPGRGGQPMPVSGLVGYATLGGASPAVRLALLAGSLVHIGDDVVFGNGAYSVLGGGLV